MHGVSSIQVYFGFVQLRKAPKCACTGVVFHCNRIMVLIDGETMIVYILIVCWNGVVYILYA